MLRPTSWVALKSLGFSGRLFTEGTAPFTIQSKFLPGTLLLWGKLVPANFKDFSLSLRLKNVWLIRTPFLILCDKAPNWKKIPGTCRMFHMSHNGHSKPFTFKNPCTSKCEIGVQVTVRVVRWILSVAHSPGFWENPGGLLVLNLWHCLRSPFSGSHRIVISQ